MLWELKQAKTLNKFVAQALRRRQPFPPGLIAPDVFPWLGIFWRAFLDLMGDRHAPDMMIPWTAREAWARRHTLDDEATALLHTHIKAMDMALLQWRAENAKTVGDSPGAGRGNFRTIRESNQSRGGHG